MAKKSRTDNDQDRLAQVEQSDLGESQLNEEFVDWLKKWGNQILLVILVIALLGVGWQWLVRTRMETRDAAWATLDTAQLPASLEEVAQNAKGVDSIAPLALIQAGDQYLRSVQTGTRFDREATAEDFEQAEFRDRLQDELADVQTFLLYLAQAAGVDLAAAVRAKLKKNAAKYPVEKARGSARKYDQLN